MKRRGNDGRWLLQNRHPGATYFELEKVGRPSRWNTLRALLRVLHWYRMVKSRHPLLMLKGADVASTAAE